MLQAFSASSPRPPCMPLAYTPSPSASSPSPTDGAFILVTLPEHTTICVNGYCSDPLYYALPGISPQGFRNLGNGAIYDATQGLMWQQDLLPNEYPYVSFPDATNDNFGTINSAANACYALRIGGAQLPLLAAASQASSPSKHSILRLLHLFSRLYQQGTPTGVCLHAASCTVGPTTACRPLRTPRISPSPTPPRTRRIGPSLGARSMTTSACI